MKFTSAQIVHNPKKTHTAQLKQEVESFLTEKGIKVSQDGEVLITIGGDGTVLYHRKIISQKPVFGIGTASSFICSATHVTWKQELMKVIEHGYSVDERPMVSCELNGKLLDEGINEVWLRNSGHRIMNIDLQIDDKTFLFRSDGIIVSTPLGSSSYAYSCGGDELPLHSKKFSIVAIAPYRRSFKPLAVSDESVCKIVAECESPYFVAVDGQMVKELDKRTELKIYKSKNRAKFAIPIQK
ncbi:NAD kinase [Candidatus Gugararchaeum adminiculabundum]|nr:NAD kinase [Candidatus Gugararchaeum adminiculabundum]